ncbi:MAG: hypothetical protein ACLP0J_27070 [Solirubrobacteraceae bacterium]
MRIATGSPSVFGAIFSTIAPGSPWKASLAGAAGQPAGPGSAMPAG